MASEDLTDFLRAPPLERVELVINEEVKSLVDHNAKHTFLMDLRVHVEKELRRMEWAAMDGVHHE